MALSKLAVTRLTKLADFMAKLPKSANKHFDMGSWFEHDGDHEHKFGKTISRRDLTLCGTTACALGWGATMPYFKKLGMSVSRTGDILFKGRMPTYTIDVAAHVFDIETGSAIDLFSGNVKANTPKQWAAHCRKFIKENRASR